jgi:hypothetical protein
MTTYRTGNHWGVTIVREGDVRVQGRLSPDGPVVPPHTIGDQLVAVVVNGDQALAERICALLNGDSEVRTRLRELTDPDPCWFDHHGGCQAHGFLSLKPGEKCPNARALELLG